MTASGWRQALGSVVAFTFGHMVTLAAGHYGIAPSAGWFNPLVELSIPLSIIATGVAIFANRAAIFGPILLLTVGLIHDYGFAASAPAAMFPGGFDAWSLLAFALGLRLCQFVIYALFLPLVLLLDRALPVTKSTWRRGLALGVAMLAVAESWARLSLATNAFGIA